MIALPVLVQSVVNGNSNGATVGTFDGGTNQLTTIANLLTSGHTRNYVAQYFVPTTTGSYDIGLSASSEDTVLVLYSSNFDPAKPGLNGMTVIDDYAGARPTGINVASGSCGATDPNGSFCPQITANLTGGRTYFIVVTSYAPNMTVSDGVNMYVYGSPVLIGNAAQENAKESSKQLLKLSLSDVLKNLGRINEKFMDGAVKRHSVSFSGVRQQLHSSESFLSHNEESIKNMAVGDDSLGVYWSDHNITKKTENSSVILESYIEHQSRSGVQEQRDINFKAAKETYNQKNKTTGISLEFQSNSHKLGNHDESKFRHINFLIGTYSVQSLRPDLSMQGHLSAGMGRGKQEIVSNSQLWTSDFDTKSLLIGGSLTGVISVNPYSNYKSKKQIEIWPTLSFEHSAIKASNLDSTFEYGQINNNLGVTGQKATVTSLVLAPKFLFIDGSQSFQKTYAFAPRFVCRRVDVRGSKQNCGFGLDFSIFHKMTGYKFVDFSLQKIGDHQSTVAFLDLKVPF